LISFKSERHGKHSAEVKRTHPLAESTMTALFDPPTYLRQRNDSGVEDFRLKSSGQINISKSNPNILDSLKLDDRRQLTLPKKGGCSVSCGYPFRRMWR